MKEEKNDTDSNMEEIIGYHKIDIEKADVRLEDAKSRNNKLRRQNNILIVMIIAVSIMILLRVFSSSDVLG